jgi:NAD(P)-dependent dehydrogenase (short-subunit alcohol dehydrogenase family)
MTSTDDSPIPDYRDRLNMAGRPFLVLGAGQGIGRQTCHALSQAGASLVCVDRDESLAKEIAAETGGIACTADITSRADVERCVRTAFDGLFGVIDIVGVSHFNNLVDIPDEEWDSTFDIVLRHVFLTSQIAGRVLASRGGGVMLFVASVSGLTSAPQHAAYGAAKAGLLSLVRTAATELGPSGVRVNAVAPGGVLTPRWGPKFTSEIKAKTEAVIPLRRMAVPDDIANSLLFLASDLASFITGQVLTVDGGGHINFPYGSQEQHLGKSESGEGSTEQS